MTETAAVASSSHPLPAWLADHLAAGLAPAQASALVGDPVAALALATRSLGGRRRLGHGPFDSTRSQPVC